MAAPLAPCARNCASELANASRCAHDGRDFQGTTRARAGKAHSDARARSEFLVSNPNPDHKILADYAEFHHGNAPQEYFAIGVWQ